MALLHMCIWWGRIAGVPIEAVTVNHGLRAAAADEAAMVAAFCANAGISHTIINWDGTQAEGNVQAAARDARYVMMADWAKGRGIGHIMLGHTADDVAETFLMRLARKSGVDGLAAMDAQFERYNVQWARPLWQQTRADLRDYLSRHEVSWIEDPSNEDLSQTRPKARKVLEALAPLGIDVEGLKSTALALAMAKGALEHLAIEEARRVVTFEAGDVIIPTRSRPPVHPETQRRLHLAAIQYVNGGDYPPREMAMIHLDVALIKQDHHTVAGCLVSKVEGGLRYGRELNAAAAPVIWGDRKRSISWDGRWEISGADDCTVQGELTVRALGDALSQVPDWRDLGLPRASLMASPAIFMNDQLISAPMAGLQNGFSARIVADYTSFLLSR